MIIHIESEKVSEDGVVQLLYVGNIQPHGGWSNKQTGNVREKIHVNSFAFIVADRLPPLNGLPCNHNTHEAQASLVNQLLSEMLPRQSDSTPLTPLVFVNTVWREK